MISNKKNLDPEPCITPKNELIFTIRFSLNKFTLVQNYRP